MSDSKVALVTGATRGIGRATVEALISAGRQVVASGRDRTALDALAQAHPGRIQTIAADLSQTGAADELVEEVLRLAPMVNEVVYSAGVVHYASIGKVSERSLRAQLELNFVAPFLISQRLGLHLRTRGAGVIVHVASTLGLHPAASTAAYGASKAALIQATRSLALELAPQVRVNAVAPGIVDTDMIRVLREPVVGDASTHPHALDAQLQTLAALHPLGRLGTPAEVAQAILFLLDASWITGTTLRIDGGLLVA